MHNLNFLKVTDENTINITANLAKEISNEYFTPIIGRNQVEYMLDKFQSSKAMTDQTKEGYLYYLIKDSGSK